MEPKLYYSRDEMKRINIEKLEELAKNIQKSALCGLGQTAPNPVLSTIKYFIHSFCTYSTWRTLTTRFILCKF